MNEFRKIFSLDQMGESNQKTALIAGVPALIIRADDGTFHAMEDNCSHAVKPLEGGEISGNEITCPFHGAKFDITTGEALCLPASQPIQIFDVEVRENDLFARKKIVEKPVVEKTETPESDASNLDGSEPSLLEALKEVIDPELMVNIVDLGLIYEISNEDGNVKVDMTLTSPACPVGPQLVQQSKMALEKIPSVKEVDVNLVMSPPWSPDRMTDDARDQLGIF